MNVRAAAGSTAVGYAAMSRGPAGSSLRQVRLVTTSGRGTDDGVAQMRETWMRRNMPCGPPQEYPASDPRHSLRASWAVAGRAAPAVPVSRSAASNAWSVRLVTETSSGPGWPNVADHRTVPRRFPDPAGRGLPVREDPRLLRAEGVVLAQRPADEAGAPAGPALPRAPSPPLAPAAG